MCSFTMSYNVLAQKITGTIIIYYSPKTNLTQQGVL